MHRPEHGLSATCRCLTDDLDFSEIDCDRPLSELSDRSEVVKHFIDKRGESPVGAETIRAPGAEADRVLAA